MRRVIKGLIFIGIPVGLAAYGVATQGIHLSIGAVSGLILALASGISLTVQ